MLSWYFGGAIEMLVTYAAMTPKGHRVRVISGRYAGKTGTVDPNAQIPTCYNTHRSSRLNHNLHRQVMSQKRVQLFTLLAV